MLDQKRRRSGPPRTTRSSTRGGPKPGGRTLWKSKVQHTQEFSWRSLATDTAVGAGFGFAGGVAGQALGQFVAPAARAAAASVGASIKSAMGPGVRAAGSTLANGARRAAPKLGGAANGRVAGGGAARPTCFVAGTLIATESGGRAIEDIEVGDRVWAKDLSTGEDMLRTVDKAFVRVTTRLVYVSVAGETLSTTADHPFFVEGRGWVNAGSLVEGDELVTPTGNAIVERVQDAEASMSTVVYNFRVEGLHNYYVLAGSTRVLVHNANYAEADLADALGDPDLMLHYTDEAGLKGILDSGAIRANSNGRAYVTGDAVSAGEANNVLFAGNRQYLGRGTHVIALRRPEGALMRPGEQPNELFHQGSIRFGADDVIFAGANPF